MDARRHDARQAFREAADKLAALEARLNEEQRARYRLLRDRQEADLRRETERVERARERYEAERKKHKVEATLDMVRRSAASPTELRYAARDYATRQHFVEQCRQLHVQDRLRFLERTVEAREPERVLDRAATREPRQDTGQTSAATERTMEDSARTADDRREQARLRLERAWARETNAVDRTRLRE